MMVKGMGGVGWMALRFLMSIAMTANGFGFENVENWRFDDGSKSLYRCFFVDESERA